MCAAYNKMSRRFSSRTNSWVSGTPSGLQTVHRRSRSYSLHPSSLTSRTGSIVRLTAAVKKPTENASYEYIGFLMPVYMAPMLFGGKEGICFYCILLPLAWWALSSIPRPVAAFLPFVTLPIFNIMDPDHLSTAFFSVDVLAAVTFLGLMMVFYSQSTLIPRVSFRVCGFFGLQMRYLFVWLSVVTYLTTQFVSNTLLAMLLVLAIDKILNCVHEQQLDVHHSINVSEEPGLFQVPGVKSTPMEQDTDVLFDELSAAVFKYRKQSEASRRSLYRSSCQVESLPLRKLRSNDAPPVSLRSSTRAESGCVGVDNASGAATRASAAPVKMVTSPGDVPTALVDASFTPVIASVTPVNADAFLASVSTSMLTCDKKDSKQSPESKTSGLPDPAQIPLPDLLLLDGKKKKGKHNKGIQQKTQATPARNNGSGRREGRKKGKKRSVCIKMDAVQNIEPNGQKAAQQPVYDSEHKTAVYHPKSPSASRESERSPSGQMVTFTPNSDVESCKAASPEPLAEAKWSDGEEQPCEEKGGASHLQMGIEGDPRRPSILKVRDPWGTTHSPRLYSPRRFSVVDFGPTTCRTLSDQFLPETSSMGRQGKSDQDAQRDSKQNYPDGRVPRFALKEQQHFGKITSPSAVRAELGGTTEED